MGVFKTVTSAVGKAAKKLGNAAKAGTNAFLADAANQMAVFSGAMQKTENLQAQSYFQNYFDSLQNEVTSAFIERPALACDFIGSFCMINEYRGAKNRWSQAGNSFDMVSGAHYRFFPIATLNIPSVGLMWSISQDVIATPTPSFSWDGVQVEMYMPSSLNQRYYGRLYKEQFDDGMLVCGALNGLEFIVSLYRRDANSGVNSEMIPFMAFKDIHLTTLNLSNLSYDTKDFMRVKGGIYGSDFEFFHYDLNSDLDYDMNDLPGQEINFG